MQRSELDRFNLPDVPGVYLFKKGRRVIYIGKATSLRDRVRSYFDDDLIAARGPRIVDMVTQATALTYQSTATVLEALVLEAALIKKYQPRANAIGKDDKSFLYAVITREPIPRVLTVRKKDIDFEKKSAPLPLMTELESIYGPFTSGSQLREALRLIRRIFPFFDTQKPVGSRSKHQAAKIEFNAQIEQYPRDVTEYRRTIRHVKLLLSGRGKELRASLAREMRRAARDERFEEAMEARRALFALDHLQDVSLIKDEHRRADGEPHAEEGKGMRIEAYDTAHLAGTSAIGVMTVVEGGEPVKREYRTFRIRGVKKNDDVGSLKEILSRRLDHPEWPFPGVIVIDGGAAQKRAAETVLKERGFAIPVVGVVKDERHRPREVIGARRAGVLEADAVLANAEAHRFSLARHRIARAQALHLK
ncbi:hypothetical protein KGM48_01335 [Patescibacteria group bacterium]|nr:hypothetical protein [Patescibacteria group bacterium]